MKIFLPTFFSLIFQVQSISSTNSGDHGTPRYWIVPVRGGAFVQRLSVWFGKVHLQISCISRAVLIHFTMAKMRFRDVTGVLVYLRCPEQVSRALFHFVLQNKSSYKRKLKK